MKYRVYVVLIFIIGLINFLPVAGLFSTAQMSEAYGLQLSGAEIAVLMRHRALLFGIIGGFVWFSLFRPLFRPVALVMSGISMIGFMVLVLIEGSLNTEITNIFMVDVAGVICLVLALVMQSMWKLDNKNN